MTEPTIGAGFASALLDFAVARGGDAQALLGRSGVRRADLADPDGRIPLARYAALLATAVDLCGEPDLALRFGAEVGMEEVSIVGLICAAAPTTREAGVQLNRYAKLLLDQPAPTPPLDVVQDQDGTWLVFENASYRGDRLLWEASVARSVRGFRRYDPDGTHLLAVHLKHAAPAHQAAYETFLMAPVVFSSTWNALLIKPAFLDLRMPPSNRYVFSVLSERADALLKALESNRSVRGRVESLLLPILHTGAASMAAVAADMGVSRQTLHRRLKDEGARFQDVVDDLRRRLALDYLAGKKVSVNETAYLVGFSDAAAFSRAFKRWTGVSPSRARDALERS